MNTSKAWRGLSDGMFSKNSKHADSAPRQKASTATKDVQKPTYKRLDEALGEGNTATVHLAQRHPGSKLVAMKISKRSAKDNSPSNAAFVAEYKVARSLKHQNIVQTHELLIVDGRLAMVSDFVEECLFDRVQSKTLTPQEIKSCFKQIVAGVKYLHEQNLAHRDLKLENMLLDKDGTVKLIDFGTVASGRSIRTGEFGTRPYIAPELFSASHYDPQAADVWSVAIVFVCMIVGRFPWMSADKTNQKFATYTRMQKAGEAFSFPDWTGCPVLNRYQDVVRLMLHIDPKRRPSMAKVSAMLTDIEADEAVRKLVTVTISEVQSEGSSPASSVC